MADRPILFSGPMVRAIREGRKTQTRRVVKPQPLSVQGELHTGGMWLFDNRLNVACPYGQPGGRLWVRETLRKRDGWPWEYAADNSPVEVSETDKTAMLVWAHHKESDTCVSIHMPRWASRITLEVLAVRVERLQDISEQDAIAEGIRKQSSSGLAANERKEETGTPHGSAYRERDGLRTESEQSLGSANVAMPMESPVNASCAFRPLDQFRQLWESINGPGSWEKNPWVWVIDFKAVARG